MKTRADDQRTAMEEALEMIAKGRPQDAAETLSAALEAPTDERAARSAVTREQVSKDFETLADEKHHSSVFRASERIRQYLAAVEERASSARDAALEEAAQRADGGPLYVRGVLMQPSERIRALQSAPAQVVSKAEVRDALLASAQRARNVAERAEVDMLAQRLGVDLDAAPAKSTGPMGCCDLYGTPHESCRHGPEGSR